MRPPIWRNDLPFPVQSHLVMLLPAQIGQATIREEAVRVLDQLPDQAAVIGSLLASKHGRFVAKNLRDADTHWTFEYSPTKP